MVLLYTNAQQVPVFCPLAAPLLLSGMPQVLDIHRMALVHVFSTRTDDSGCHDNSNSDHTSSCAAVQRLAGSFCSIQSTKLIRSEATLVSLGGVPSTMSASSPQYPELSSISNGKLPVTHSNSTRPMDHISAGCPYRVLPLMRSGDMYVAVPTKLCTHSALLCC